MTIHEFIGRETITATAERVDSNPNMDDRNMDHWKVKLSRKFGSVRRSMTVPFSMGFGLNGQEPEAADVLNCLASDMTDESFEDWCHEVGYDTDSRKSERTYKAIQRQSDKLRAFLEDAALEVLRYKVERL